MNGLAVADSAYRDLLRVSFNEMFRVRNQALYAALRDAIATETGLTSEMVQNYYESRGNGVDSPTTSVHVDFRKKAIIEEVQSSVPGAAGKD